MATIKEYFYNVQCDCCMRIADEEMWHNERTTAQDVADEEGWIHRGDKDYCPDCWHYDDNDNIVTADGKVWDGDTDEEIKEEQI